MVFKNLFLLSMNRSLIVTAVAALFIVGGFMVASLAVVKGNSVEEIFDFQSAVSALTGLGYALFFVVVGDRIRSFMAYDFNHMLPDFRFNLLKVTAFHFIVLLCVPLSLLTLIDSITVLQALTIIFICIAIFLGNLFNQTISTIVGLGVYFAGVFEFKKADKDPNYQAFEFIPIPHDIALAVSIILVALCLSWVLLKMPKQLFGISKGKSRAISVNIDPLITKNKFVLMIRQLLLGFVYDVLTRFNQLKADSIVCFWNYKFTNLNYLRFAVLVLAISPFPFIDGVISGFEHAHIEKSSGESTSVDFSSLVNTASIILLAIFGIFDGNKLGAYSQASRFLWLKQRINGITPFVNQLHIMMAKLIAKEALISYAFFLLIITRVDPKYLDLTMLTFTFFTIKIANIFLMQILTGTTQRRWIWLAIAAVNVALFVGLSVIKNQTVIDPVLATSLAMTLTAILGIVFFKFNYNRQLASASLI